MHILPAALLLALIASPALSQGAKTSAAYNSSVLALKPGEFIWDETVAPAGPMTLVVNLQTQRAYAYRNGVRIGASTVSTGKAGHRTPTGVFTILQKNKDHKSNIYNNAPMPYMQRLTWDGIALHAGNLPGYPASHGCIRLPLEFSKKLFETTSTGMTVVVTDEHVEPETVADTAFLAPVNTKGKPDSPESRMLADNEAWRWTPEKSPTGPVTIVVSTDSKRIVVYRNGEEIGRSRIGVAPGFDMGTRTLQYKGQDANGLPQWVYLGVPGYQETKGQRVEPEALQAITIPTEFNIRLREVISPGTTVLATDGGIIEGASGRPLTVIASQ